MVKKIEFPKDEYFSYLHIIETVLPELFHSDCMNESAEANRFCPVCKMRFPYHVSLARHIVANHSSYLNDYSKSLSYLVEHPIEFFSAYNWGSLKGCNLCGETRMTDTEFKRHMLTHKDYFNDVIRWMRENAKK